MVKEGLSKASGVLFHLQAHMNIPGASFYGCRRALARSLGRPVYTPLMLGWKQKQEIDSSSGAVTTRDPSNTGRFCTS